MPLPPPIAAAAACSRQAPCPVALTRTPANMLCRGVAFSWRQIRGFPGLLPYGHMDAPPPPYRIERPKVGLDRAVECRAAARIDTRMRHPAG